MQKAQERQGKGRAKALKHKAKDWPVGRWDATQARHPEGLPSVPRPVAQVTDADWEGHESAS